MSSLTLTPVTPVALGSPGGGTLPTGSTDDVLMFDGANWVAGKVGASNFASGQILAVNKLTAGAAVTGQMLVFDGTDWGPANTVKPAATNTVGLTVQGMASQTADLFRASTSGGYHVVRARTDGFEAQTTTATQNVNNELNTIAAGSAALKVDANGNVFMGPNASGFDPNKGSGISQWSDFFWKANGRKLWAGRGLILNEMMDPVDLAIRRYEAPHADVAGVNTIGWNPISLTVDTLGSDATRSAWPTAGYSQYHRSNAGGLGQIRHTGRDFVTPALTGVTGETGTVGTGVTLSTTAATITMSAMIANCPSHGTLLLDGSSTVITYTGKTARYISGAGISSGTFTGCTIASGTLALSAGDTLYQRIVTAANDTIEHDIHPDPQTGANPAGTRSGVAMGSIYWQGSLVPAGGVVKGDKYTDVSDRLANIGCKTTQDLSRGSTGGKLVFATNPNGTEGVRDAVYIESIGLLNAWCGLAVGASKKLTAGTATPSVGLSGAYAETDVNLLALINNQLTGGTSPSVTIVETTPGGTGVNEVQTVTITGSPTGGTFDLSWINPSSVYGDTILGGTSVASDAVASDVQTALLAMVDTSGNPLFQAGDVAVTGTNPVFVVTFGTNATSTSSRWTITNTGAQNITNITGATDGQVIYLRSTNANTTLKNASGGSGQMRLASNADYAMGTDATVLLLYNAASTKWYEMSRAA